MARATGPGVRYADGVEPARGYLDEPVTTLVPRSAKPFASLGIRTVGDLLRHYPWRYADASTLTDIAGLTVGEDVAIVAEVREAVVRRARTTHQARLEVTITDGTRTLQLIFFGATRHHENLLRPGRRGLFSGQIGEFGGRLQLAHPTYEMFDDDVEGERQAVERAEWPRPVYRAVAGLDTAKIGRAVRTALGPLTEADVDDPLPPAVREARRLGSRRQALQDVHEPHEESQWRRGRARLRFEEAFVLQAELARRRARAAAEPATARPRVEGGLLDAFDARLPFALTAGQREVGEQVSVELAGAVPMQRLLQGEVGSGKTVVALRAMLQVVDAGGQAALLAPTEVLAAQHARSLRLLLGDLAEGGMLGGSEIGTRVALLTGSQSAAVKKAALLDAAGGAAGIVVGTHALLSATVQFADLGLVVVDEQHKFGVEQRDTLRAKAARAPHLLVMTATPIPRTVAMTVFGDLETSVLREVPAGRSGVTTHVVPADRPGWLDRTWQRVREEVDRGGRAYVVCARIDGDEQAAVDDDVDLVDDDQAASTRPPLRAVLEVVDTLRGLPALDGVRIGLLHGRMAPDDKERALADFSRGDVPVLVSTTVVEVGVDVPEATVMVVLDADRFGVSQLHQLRGRIGRGTAPGVCLLVSSAPEGTPAAARLEKLASTSDGFELATFDLEQRGEGDVLGASQWGGSSSLRLLRVTRDGEVIERARQDARALVDADPELAGWPPLRAAIDAMLTGDREEFLDRA
ncbi:ATP-dependent DNA helicase RecG [Cellulomonas sp.]|uniref:ATP-dependent DNA helicase RecG n=1 Tax=Cellulomonas sp. TaxID=40001 RepID=UPI001B02C04D|nr:ATP-dependent DNA helicase RecG [Cellulomonas sp.]MBO9556385.1 ATP-dependent DNA helicase RecG [Cellulomonas sp.]